MDLTCNQAITLLRTYRGDRFNPAYEIGTYETDVQHLVAHGLVKQGDGSVTLREYLSITDAGHTFVKVMLNTTPPDWWAHWSRRAIRQFSHNDSSGLVFGYDKQIIDDMMTKLNTRPRTVVEPDERSPAVGEGGEHTTLYAYVNGNYDIGKIELDGFTLVSNNDLAMYKAGQPVVPALPPAPPLTIQQVKRLRQLINRYSAAKVAESWAGGGDPADTPALKADALNTKRILQNFIRKLGGIENDPEADDTDGVD